MKKINISKNKNGDVLSQNTIEFFRNVKIDLDYANVYDQEFGLEVKDLLSKSDSVFDKDNKPFDKVLLVHTSHICNPSRGAMFGGFDIIDCRYNVFYYLFELKDKYVKLDALYNEKLPEEVIVEEKVDGIRKSLTETDQSNVPMKDPSLSVMPNDERVANAAIIRKKISLMSKRKFRVIARGQLGKSDFYTFNPSNLYGSVNAQDQVLRDLARSVAQRMFDDVVVKTHVFYKKDEGTKNKN